MSLTGTGWSLEFVLFTSKNGSNAEVPAGSLVGSLAALGRLIVPPLFFAAAAFALMCSASATRTLREARALDLVVTSSYFQYPQLYDFTITQIHCFMARDYIKLKVDKH
ncbi:hypothetical protein R1flu_001574 [Riccia fluitans]|uniref:Uncharacterized protein n=1 Tax=Riccia fluitans TaxID=41844 RepID=A0ABD1Y4N8_9MARC